MDYENMSDFEINKRVAEALGKFEYVSDNNLDGGSAVLCDSLRACDEYDYCNSPSDAWPIITSNAIDIEFAVDSLGGIGQAHVYVEGDTDLECNFNDNSKALRAACIVYLMIQEAKC